MNTALPPYRGTFVRAWRRHDSRVRFASGVSQFDETVQLGLPKSEVDRILCNHYFAGRRVVVQKGLGDIPMTAEVLIGELNPRILTTWTSLSRRKAAGLPTLLWGHAFPRAGEQSGTDNVRVVLRRLADAVVTYTESEMVRLREQGITAFAAPNALYESNRIRAMKGTHRTDVIMSCRLEAPKKPGLGLEAFSHITDKLDGKARLHVVGEGSLQRQLRQRANDLSIGERVVFHGEQYDDEYLEELYGRCFASISPGYVGLSITQSVCHGVPMVYAREEPHAPEIEIRDRIPEAAYSCGSNDVGALSEQILFVQRQMVENEEAFDKIADQARVLYSAERMVAGFSNAAAHVLG